MIVEVRHRSKEQRGTEMSDRKIGTRHDGVMKRGVQTDHPNESGGCLHRQQQSRDSALLGFSRGGVQREQVLPLQKRERSHKSRIYVWLEL